MAQAKTREIDLEELDVFGRWLGILNGLQIPYLLGGAFAVYLQAGIRRNTKDMDVFLQPKDLKRALDGFSAAGYKTEIPFPHWLAKVHHGDYFSDLLFGFWNGKLHTIDDWLSRSQPALFAGVTVPLISLEDLIYSKVYVASRDRFDGGDIVHLIHTAKGKVKWEVILDQLGDDYALLLWHLILYDYVYPGHSEDFEEVMVKLFERLRQGLTGKFPSTYFRGPLLDPLTFDFDMQKLDYMDPRDMTPLVDKEGNLL